MPTSQESLRPNDRPLLAWVSALAVGGAMVLLLILERRRPLRRENESHTRRDGRNLVMAGLAAGAIRLTEQPLTTPLTRLVQRRNIGLVKLLRLPPWLEAALACLLLDYTLYLWHVLTHKVPTLWRFHRVHHADLDLSTSTGLRFHFGEMTISSLFRAGQVLLIGVSPRAFSIWSTLLLIEVMFHHSNVELSESVERRLRWLIVTPRMHGIHHSTIRAEMDSNWSSGLTIWDVLHGTLLLGIPQDQIEIGVATLREPKQVTLPRIAVMPFGPQPAQEGTGIPARGVSPTREWRQLVTSSASSSAPLA